ncbi:MAG: hypothetical protein IK104_06155 [Clostridia bacterium]|nr:hypothetical protein [Clostridia bacterium]
MTTCEVCGKELDVWDAGFYKKLVNRGAEPKRCLACTANYFRMSRETALGMIRSFQRAGCTLFPAEGEPPLPEDTDRRE